jgi:Domain of unknown function (DUF4123)
VALGCMVLHEDVGDSGWCAGRADCKGGRPIPPAQVLPLCRQHFSATEGGGAVHGALRSRRRAVLENGWGNAWGVFFSSSAQLETLRKHFRMFLRVTDEAGRRLLFRFYDPRVLSIYLPTCNNEELTTIFGPIDRFVVEKGEGAEAVEYRFSGVRLKLRSLRSDEEGNERGGGATA